MYCVVELKESNKTEWDRFLNLGYNVFFLSLEDQSRIMIEKHDLKMEDVLKFENVQNAWGISEEAAEELSLFMYPKMKDGIMILDLNNSIHRKMLQNKA